MKFVTTDNNGIVVDPYDDKYKNVPAGAIRITDEEYAMLASRPCSHFKIIDGTLETRDDISDVLKSEIVSGVDNNEFMKALVELLIDQINILRVDLNKQPITLAKFKAAMKNKLT